jgi:hypothetical protein
VRLFRCECAQSAGPSGNTKKNANISSAFSAKRNFAGSAFQ